VQADGRQTLGFRVEVAGDGVCRGDVAGVRVRVAQEVGEGDGGEGVVVGVFFAVEFDHFGFAAAAAAGEGFNAMDAGESDVAVGMS